MITYARSIAGMTEQDRVEFDAALSDRRVAAGGDLPGLSASDMLAVLAAGGEVG